MAFIRRDWLATGVDRQAQVERSLLFAGTCRAAVSRGEMP